MAAFSAGFAGMYRRRGRFKAQLQESSGCRQSCDNGRQFCRRRGLDGLCASMPCSARIILARLREERDVNKFEPN
jgi:hypothetical protein